LTTTTTTKTMKAKYFKEKQKVLQNLLHGQIWPDFEKVSLKMSDKASIFSKWEINKFY
jgi:hypothetical protein